MGIRHVSMLRVSHQKFIFHRKASNEKTTTFCYLNEIHWWNEELSDITRMKKRMMNAWTHEKTEEFKVKHRKYEDLQRKMMREARKKSWEEFAMSINSFVSSTQAWNKIKAIKGSKSKSKRLVSIEVEGETVSKSTEVAEEFAKHFYEVSKKPSELNTKNEIKVDLNVE